MERNLQPEVESRDQLSWEGRFGRLAAAAAFAAIVSQVASVLVQVPALKAAPGRDDPLRYRQTILNFQDHSGALLGSAVTQAIGTFLAAGALYYLFRATRHRRPELPQVVQWLLVIAPVLVAIAVVVNWTGLNSAADRYTSPKDFAEVRATPSRDQRKDIADFCRKHARGPVVPRCRATRGRQEAVAKKLIQENQGALGAATLFAGTLALAFSYLIISLNAMRAGLLSRFMGILGVIVGVLIVLPLLPQGVPVVQIFWLGALGVLFLDKWPGGRGPAWETGEATPWPVPERLSAPAGEEPEPEPVEEPGKLRQTTRKRKRKRRR